MIKTLISNSFYPQSYLHPMSSVVVETRLPVEPTTSLITLPDNGRRDDLEEIHSDPTKSFAESPIDIAEVPVVMQLPFIDGVTVNASPNLNLNVSIQEPPMTVAPSRLQHMREAASYLSFFLAGYKLGGHHSVYH